MNILYGIQGTGHGHISRAREIVPALAEESEITLLISGYNCKLQLDGYDPIQKRGISLAYNSEGGVSYLKTLAEVNPALFLWDLFRLDLEKFDLIISDYEPITAWAASMRKKPSLALSHQASFLSAASPRPARTSWFAEQILKKFAPCKHSIGFHFRTYDNFILPPVVRQEVLGLTPTTQRHTTVYLPAFNPELLTTLFHQFPDMEWQVFSPLCTSVTIDKNVTIYPVSNSLFLQSLGSSSGVIAGAGFETCAEAMHLGKKLLVVPIQNQYEQLCNAAALRRIGIHVVWNPKHNFSEQIRFWLDHAEVVSLPEFVDIKKLTSQILQFSNETETPFWNEISAAKAS